MVQVSRHHAHQKDQPDHRRDFARMGWMGPKGPLMFFRGSAGAYNMWLERLRLRAVSHWRWETDHHQDGSGPRLWSPWLKKMARKNVGKKKGCESQFSWAATSTSLDPCTFHHLFSLHPFGPHPMLHCCRRTPCSRGSWWWICDPKKTGRVLRTWNWWPSSCTVALSMAGRGGPTLPTRRPCMPMSCTLERSGPRIATPLREKRRYLRKERYTPPFGIPFGIWMLSNYGKLWQIMPIVRFTQFYCGIFWVNWYTGKLAEPRIFCTKWWFLYCRTSAVISGMGPTNLKSTPICKVHLVYKR